jgi:hypothetical protein
LATLKASLLRAGLLAGAGELLGPGMGRLAYSQRIVATVTE